MGIREALLRLVAGTFISLFYWTIFAVVVWLGFRLFGRTQPFANPSEAARIRGRMKRMARPTLLLTPTKTPGFSKLGGEPELPANAEWPTGEKGPLPFIAQLDLAEIRAAAGPEWLPDAGALYVFNDDQRYGFVDHMRLIYAPHGERALRPAPASLGKKQRFAERRVGFLRMNSVPSLDWLGVDLHESGLSDQELDELSEAPDADFGDELQHRIGGYPSEIQNSQMGVECEYLARGLTLDYEAEIPGAILRASRSWRLLLQVDTDEALGMEWGDGGRLYLFIREQHARTGKFDRTVAIWQTH